MSEVPLLVSYERGTPVLRIVNGGAPKLSVTSSFGAHPLLAFAHLNQGCDPDRLLGWSLSDADCWGVSHSIRSPYSNCYAINKLLFKLKRQK